MNEPSRDPLDAVIAAPQHHRLLMENQHVRVLATRVEPGETVPVHVHPWPAVLHIASAGHFVRRDPEGEVLLDSRALDPPFEPPEVMRTEPVPPPTFENVGAVAWGSVSVELKDG